MSSNKMGKRGMDRWCSIIEEHERMGDPIIKYTEPDAKIEQKHEGDI